MRRISAAALGTGHIQWMTRSSTKCSKLALRPWTQRDPRQWQRSIRRVSSRPASEPPRLLDDGSFVEYGALAVPANKTMTSPADGLVQCFGTVHSRPVAIVSYDYTVQGGTQTALNHGNSTV